MKISIGFDKYAIHDKPEIIKSGDSGIIIIHLWGLNIDILRGWYAEQYKREIKKLDANKS